MQGQRLARAALASALILSGPGATGAWAAASITILHNNDGESQLLNAGSGIENFGGIAHFVTAVEQTRAAKIGAGREVFTVSSGDNFLAGPEFNASLATGPLGSRTYFDALALNAIGYDAIALGNHDFDFGPELLADFIGAVDSSVPYLSANLNFAGEASLNALVGTRIQSSIQVTKNETGGGDVTIGIIGATTEQLASISSPGNVAINPVLAAVQAEIDNLVLAGVDKIVLISHLQDLNNELDLIQQLNGVDVVIAGGGDEFLANSGDALNATPDGPYPIQTTDAGGNPVVVVTTQGNYRYLGALDVEFDDNGVVTAFGGDPILIENTIAPDAVMVDTVETPVAAALAGLAANVIAQSDVPLDGLRNNVRSTETNLGDIITDAYIFNAKQAAPELFADGDPIIAFTNGGGIRNDTVIAAGPITELDTFDILPFSNFLTVFEDITVEQLKELMEHAVARTPATAGQFAQISGFKIVYGPGEPDGEKILAILLEDGTVLYENGVDVFGGTLDLVTIDFLARDGDAYPFSALGLTDFTNIGISYQQALFNFLTSTETAMGMSGLGGQVLASQYPVGGLGRIDAVPEPMSAALLALGALVLLRRRVAA